MNKKKFFLILFAFFFTNIISCTRKVKPLSKAYIQLPKSEINNYNSLSYLKPSDPSALAAVDCYAVFVSSPNLNNSYCEGTNLDATNTRNFPYFEFYGTFPSGSLAEIIVPNGPQRRFSIIAFSKTTDTQCQNLRDPLRNDNDFSSPFYIGTSGFHDLSGGVIDIPIKVSFNSTSTYKMGNCYGRNIPSGGTTNGPAPSVDLTLSSVDPIYGTYGANWNDYVDFNPNLGTLAQTETLCFTSGFGFQTCAHGGELKKVRVTGASDCNRFYATDALDAFKWHCKETGANEMTFFTKRLRPGIFLKDLIVGTGTSFKNNSLTIYDNSNAADFWSTSEAIWWSNPVAIAPDASISRPNLNEPGKIYVVNSVVNSVGFEITNSRISLVSLSGSKIDFIGTTPNCDVTNSSNIGPDLCHILAFNQDHLWIEVDQNDPVGTYDNYPFLFDNLRFSKIIGSTSVNFNSALNLSNSQSNYIHAFFASGRAGGNQLNGIQLLNSSHNTLYHLQLTNFIDGLLIGQSSSKNKVIFLSSYNNSQNGVSISGTSPNSNSFTQILSHHNTNHGINIEGYNNTLAFSSFFSNRVDGLHINSSNGDTHSVVTSGNTTGVNHTNVTNYQMSDLVTTNNSMFGYYSVGSNNTSVVGYNILGNNASSDCSDGGSNSSIAFSDNSCTGAGTRYTNRSLLGNFIGNVTIDDLDNSSDSSGSQSFALINDWLRFENDFRGWGPQLTNELTTTASICQGGTCQIYDYSLLNTGNVIYNNSFDGNNPNPPLGTGLCPPVLNSYYIDQQSPSNSFLLRAIELIGDLNGDDDGLCESNEVCIYTPNIGAYQGETGAGLSPISCAYQDSTVAGVQLLVPNVNGQ